MNDDASAAPTVLLHHLADLRVRFQVCVIDTVARAVDAGTLAEHDAAELNENLAVRSPVLTSRAL